MKFKMKFVILSFSLVLLGTIGYYVYWGFETEPLVSSANQVGGILMDYTKMTGQFPTSLKDIENKHLLKVVSNRTGVSYYVASPFADFNDPNREANWNIVSNFTQLRIAYGIKKEEIVCKDKKLFSKSTGSQIFLVDSTYDCSYVNHLRKWTFEPISMQLYNLMKE